MADGHGSRALAEALNLAAVVRDSRHGRRLLLLLDYDGSLVPLMADPAAAQPDTELLTLLAAVCAAHGVEAHVVSGRRRDTLECWLGTLALGLHAEHGLWSRRPGSVAWSDVAVQPLGMWIERVRVLFSQFTAETQGSVMEEKALGMAWHYRGADARTGRQQAGVLLQRLEGLLDGSPLEVFEGKRVIEVRPRGVNKGRVAAAVVAWMPHAVLAVAIGDDQTDEDMFTALPDDAVTIRVGGGATRARYRLADVAAVRAFLRLVAEEHGV